MWFLICNVCVCVGYCGWLWFRVWGLVGMFIVGLLVVDVVLFVGCIGVLFLNGEVGCGVVGLILCFGCFLIFFIGFGFGLGFGLGLGFLIIMGVFLGGLGIGFGFGLGLIIGFGGGWIVWGGFRLVGEIIVIVIGCVGVGNLIIWCIEV